MQILGNRLVLAVIITTSITLLLVIYLYECDTRAHTIEVISKESKLNFCSDQLVVLLQLKKGGVAKAICEGEKEKECTTECKSDGDGMRRPPGH